MRELAYMELEDLQSGIIGLNCVLGGPNSTPETYEVRAYAWRQPAEYAKAQKNLTSAKKLKSR